MDRSADGPLAESDEVETETLSAAGPRLGARSDSSKDPYAVARSIVLRRLTLSARTRAELREALTKREVSVDVQEEVLDRFTELGLIDDVALAKSFVAYRSENGRGRRAIAFKLRARGVADDVIESALSDVTDEAELMQAKVLVQRRWSRMSQLERAVRTRRLRGMLGRRGYAAHIVAGAIREVEAETEEARQASQDLGIEV